MNVLIQLAFLSYYRYSFFLVDFLLFLWICFGFYHLTYKVLPLLIPEEKQEKFEWVRKTLTVLLGTQMCFYVFLLLVLLFRKPLLIHFKTKAGISGFVFVMLVIFRLVNIMMVSAFLACCWMFLEDQEKTMYVKRWFLLIAVLLLYYLWTLFYMLFPTMNKALEIHELFYNIRNLYIVKDREKKYKTFLYLQQFGCVPSSYSTLYEDEWKRTFQNPVMVPLECSS
jgi:hypothetical protein